MSRDDDHEAAIVFPNSTRVEARDFQVTKTGVWSERLVIISDRGSSDMPGTTTRALEMSVLDGVCWTQTATSCASRTVN